MKRVSIPITLYAFGNKKQPRSPRQNKDIEVINDHVNKTQPPTGASTFSNIEYAPLTGHYYRLEKNTTLPEGLDIIADGKDVGGNHSRGHYTIYPSREMTFQEFVDKFINSGWIYTGKKGI